MQVCSPRLRVSYFCGMTSEHLNDSRGKEIPYEIPAEGSLALLALGFKGLTAWRKKRAQAEEEKQKAANRDDKKDQ